MSRRPTSPPGEGRPPAPAQEAAVPPVEKKKVDAAFWDKFKEFQKMPPEERVPAIETFLAQYEKLHGSEGIKKDIFSMVFAHPEWCRAAALQERWCVDRRKRDMGHGIQHQIDIYQESLDDAKEKGKDTSAIERELENLKAPFGEGEKFFYETQAKILEDASKGMFPSDEIIREHAAKHGEGRMWYELKQTAWQEGIHRLQISLELRYKIGRIEQSQWLADMDNTEMERILWAWHDERETGSRAIEAAGKIIIPEIKKWREGKGE